MPPALELRNFKAIGEENKILSSASFSLERGEKLCIYGPSGSGKSILLSFINGRTIEELSYSHDTFFQQGMSKIYLNYNNKKGEKTSPDNFESELILIDEPENHFSIEELKQILENTTPMATVIFVTHHLDFVENVSDKVLVLHYGAFKGVYNTKDFFTSKDPYISYIATMGC